MPTNSAVLWNELIKTYQTSDIRFPRLKAVTLAQWALESARGTSRLAVDHYNFGGLKYRERMVGHARPVDYEAHDGTATYCAFDDIPAFIRGYWRFIDAGPYDGYEAFAEDPAGYLQHIASKGYAADPNYVNKVMRLLAETEEALGDTEGGEPVRPNRLVFGDYTPPNFESAPGIKHSVRGNRPNGLEGMIVHFDAYRIKKAGNGDEDSDRRTLDMMRSGQDNGFHYGEISRTGRVFVPENFDWNKWGYHAGPSKCPLTGREGVSQFYVGFEMNNPGKLFPAQEEGVFCPWFNCVRDTNGNPILDSQGRCRRKSASDEWYSQDQVRFAEGGNIQRGWYLPYSRDQFETLTNIAGFLLSKFPGSFSLDKVFGHDEVASPPGRKSDPGGALAYAAELMKMGEFRTFLKEKF